MNKLDSLSVSQLNQLCLSLFIAGKGSGLMAVGLNYFGFPKTAWVMLSLALILIGTTVGLCIWNMNRANKLETNNV